MNLKMATCIATLAIGLALTTPVHAHRMEGLLQSSLVEVLPTHVGVEVTLAPGIDVAASIAALLDPSGDGVFSQSESDAWSERFMAKQRVTVDGQSLPLKMQSVHATPLAEMTDGHAEIVVCFKADLGNLAHGVRTIECANQYQPIPSTYQCNGVVPRVPGVRIKSHHRENHQKELILTTEFSQTAVSTVQTRQTAPTIENNGIAWASQGFVGSTVAGAIVAVIAMCRRRPSSKRVHFEPNSTTPLRVANQLSENPGTLSELNRNSVRNPLEHCPNRIGKRTRTDFWKRESSVDGG